MTEGETRKISRRDFLKGLALAGVGFALGGCSNNEGENPEVAVPPEIKDKIKPFRRASGEEEEWIKKFLGEKVTTGTAYEEVQRIEFFEKPVFYQVSKERLSGRIGDEDYSILRSPFLERDGLVAEVSNSVKYPFYGYPVGQITNKVVDELGSRRVTYLIFRGEDLNPELSEKVGKIPTGMFFVCLKNTSVNFQPYEG